jgi:hypothetical protein
MAKKQGGKKAGDDVTGLEDLALTLGESHGGDDDATSLATDDLDKEETVARLKACAARLAKAHTFKRGQLVQWKKGLKNKVTPGYGEPVIVIETLDQPILDQHDKGSGSAYFREPLTLVAGEIDHEGDFLCFHYDGRRFEPYEAGKSLHH